MSDLNTAIQLIRQGNTAQAQKYLETIVRTEPNNVPAWLWYAQTWPSDEMRLKVLVACMKFNPGDEKVLQAIKFIRGKTSVQAKPPIAVPASPVVIEKPFDRAVEEPIEIPPIFAQIQAEQAQTFEPKSVFNWDELEQRSTPLEPAFETQVEPGGPKLAFNWGELEQRSAPAARTLAAPIQPAGSKPAFNWDEIDPEPAPVAAPAPVTDTFFDDQPSAIKTQAPGRPYRFFEVWWTALTKQDVKSYTDLLDDPHAGIGRALEWQVYTNLVIFSLSSLVAYFQIQSVFGLPNFQKLQRELPLLNSLMTQSTLLVFLFGFVLVGLVFGALGLLIGGAFQNFLAHLFGGTGNFSRTVYALSAYLVPVSIIVSVMGYIPVVGLATIAVSGYSFVLNVRALQAAHGLNGGRATIIVAIPSIILLIIACISFIVISSWMKTVLLNYPGPNMP